MAPRVHVGTSRSANARSYPPPVVKVVMLHNWDKCIHKKANKTALPEPP